MAPWPPRLIIEAHKGCCQFDPMASRPLPCTPTNGGRYGIRRRHEIKMSNYRVSPDLDMHYRIDDFTDPWLQPQTILMLHGNAESGLAWYAWVPKLARQYRVVRPDMRGFGESTPMPGGYPWTLDRL